MKISILIVIHTSSIISYEKSIITLTGLTDKQRKSNLKRWRNIFDSAPDLLFERYFFSEDTRVSNILNIYTSAKKCFF